MPEAPFVIVTFYTNPRFVLVDEVHLFNNLENFGTDEIGEYLQATMRIEAISGTWQIKFKFNSFTEGTTGAIAWNASAAEVETALNATGIGVWTVVSLGVQHYRIRMHGPPLFGSQPGMGPQSINLHGEVVERGRHDEVKYKVRLTEGCKSVGPPPPGQITPQGASSGAKPHRRPVSGQ